MDKYITQLKRINSSRGGILVFTVFMMLFFYFVYSSISEFDIYYTLPYGAILILYLLGLLDSLGYTFNKAFIHIDKQIITIGSGLVFKKGSVSWDDIQRIQFRKNDILFEKRDNKLSFISTFRIPKENFTFLKRTILEIAKAKNIEVI